MLWLLVTGSREVSAASREVVADEIVQACADADEAFLIVGDARGLDALAREIWTRPGNTNRHNILVFEADWAKHGRRAGPLRNREMIQFARDQDGTTQVLAFYQTGAENKGTADCANKARRTGHPVKEIWIR